MARFPKRLVCVGGVICVSAGCWLDLSVTIVWCGLLSWLAGKLVSATLWGGVCVSVGMGVGGSLRSGNWCLGGSVLRGCCSARSGVLVIVVFVIFGGILLSGGTEARLSTLLSTMCSTTCRASILFSTTPSMQRQGLVIHFIHSSCTTPRYSPQS